MSGDFRAIIAIVGCSVQDVDRRYPLEAENRGTLLTHPAHISSPNTSNLHHLALVEGSTCRTALLRCLERLVHKQATLVIG